MECALGAAPRVCTTSCGTGGTQPCDGACRLGTCRAATETCNNCDDDGDGQIDEPGGGSPVLCRAGDARSCTTSCGTLGTQTCGLVQSASTLHAMGRLSQRADVVAGLEQ